jgi:hypothetical protein
MLDVVVDSEIVENLPINEKSFSSSRPSSVDLIQVYSSPRVQNNSANEPSKLRFDGSAFTRALRGTPPMVRKKSKEASKKSGLRSFAIDSSPNERLTFPKTKNIGDEVTHITHEKRKRDDESTWRNFVFGNDSDEEDLCYPSRVR